MWFLFFLAAAAVYSAEGAGAGAARLVCYVQGSGVSDYNECTHLIYAGDARGEKLEVLLKEYRKNNPRLKIILRVTESDEDIASLLKSKNVQGLEVYDAHRGFNKTKVTEAVEAAKEALSSHGGGPLYLALPAHPELLAKYYDLRALVKKTDLFMVHTHALGLVKKMTYHPSRLSGLWDMMNTDSVVDLVVGLGVPASKVVISLPATARQFTLQNETLSTPGSPTEDEEPKVIDQAELCRQLQDGRWTLERDQDLSAPYAFKDKTWISFEDSSSVDVKGKYARVRGLAGLALYDAHTDNETPCGPPLRAALAKVLNQQSRAPRAAVLRSLENEILSAPSRALDALQVSPYRITQVVDSDGVIHSIREDTRTEFTCSRQGYFVHPRSCARFYRCVKFDQLSADYTVFEFDCPAGLAFDSRYEVCVWPGSLPDSAACPGSSEIAPVPRTRFVCPNVEGYYVDPENCRWFFACLDHGKSPLTAYEFRCPFGLGFDPARLTCDWPWLVPACAGIGRYEAEAFGFSGAALGGAAGFQGKTADSVNIAAHQSLLSGAALNNLVGVQSNVLSSGDRLGANFIASQEAANRAQSEEFSIDDRFTDLSEAGQGESSGISYNVVPAESINRALIGASDYSSGSLVLDDFRFSDKDNVEFASASNGDSIQVNSGNVVIANPGKYVASNAGKYVASNTGKYVASNAGKYVATNAGQYTGASGRYVASDAGKYRPSNVGLYNAGASGRYIAGDAGKYRPSDAGQYRATATGKYVASDAGKYRPSDDGQYRGSSTGKYIASNVGKYQPNNDAGKYRPDNAGKYKGLEAYAGVSPKYDTRYQSNAYYKKDDRGKYHHNPIGDHAKPYEHVSVPALGYDHTDRPYIPTTDGYDVTHSGYDYPKPAIEFNEGPAYVDNNNGNNGNNYDTVNIGYVGKTSLVDVESPHKKQPNVFIEPDVSITNPGLSYQNIDLSKYVTNPLSSITVTTPSPVTVTTYKSIYVPQPPRSSIKQIFTYNQPAVTAVQPALVSIKQTEPVIEVSNYQQGSKQYTENYNDGQSGSYDSRLPNINLNIGITYTTPSPLISVTQQIPGGFGYNQETLQEINNLGYQYSTPRPVTEEPFKKVVAYTTGSSVTIEPKYQQNIYSSQSFVSSTPSTISVTPSTINVNPFLKYSQAAKQQTQYREDTSLNTGNNYGYTSEIKYEQPQTITVSTPRPVISIQTTVNPSTFGEENIHTVDVGRVNTYNDASITGYEYSRPVEKLETVISTPAPYQTYNRKLIQQKTYVPTLVSSTPQPQINIKYEQPSVSVNVNPFLKYTQKYSDATLVSRQEFRQSFGTTNAEYENGKTMFVSTTPSVLAYEDHYTGYESPKSAIKYESIEVKPHVQYHQETNFQRSSASYPTTQIINNYNRIEEQSPEIQTAYKGEEYLPPVVTATTPIQIQTSTKAPEYLPPLEITAQPSTTSRPRVKTVEYFPPTQKTVQIPSSTNAPEYLPPVIVTSTSAPEYLPPKVVISTSAPEYLPPVENTYLPPTTAKPKLKTLEYLPPAVKQETAYEYRGDLPKSEEIRISTGAPSYSTRKQNIVVETAKSNVLGFETVGNNAGLVSTTYSTARPSISSTVDYLSPETVTTYSRVTKPVRPILSSTTPISTVSYQPSTARTFKGSDYLVPKDGSNQQSFKTVEYTTITPKVKYNPFSEVTFTGAGRKQNIVIESARAESESDLEAIEVTSAKPLRRTRPKVAVVTKLNDFNPLLVRKLGAVCSCQSPVVVLRGSKPSANTEDIEIENGTQKSSNAYTVTTSPLVSSSFNPIIVPDDSFYQDYQDSNINVEIKGASQIIQSSTSTPVVSSTQRIVKIRPRVNAVTVAPTYQTILLEKEVTSSPQLDGSESIAIESKSFNRYGPGGWRGKDETLQGSVDCQRAGLFRHPKHCNKFYSCRWDCNKEKFTLHVFDCPVQLSFDSNIGACNWPSQGPACQGDTLLNTL
ncbi:uncharacterized protein LOC121732231 isoform X2 [Aricia agestis]|uniref:uncharacterized protein LOC121732231 isoform X2 n=1 Tax=Aricia agestis TaxID=91739 RepID=UPI001C209FC6|nr:uncharacterized protein LOC121732231 isoform X2 [Aricia agestis]